MKIFLKKTVVFPAIYLIGFFVMICLVFGDPNKASEWLFQKAQSIYEWSEK